MRRTRLVAILVFALAVFGIASGVFLLRPGSANPTTVYVINDKVGAALETAAGLPVTPAQFDTQLSTSIGRTTIKNLVPFSTIEAASGNQIARDTGTAAAGCKTYILVLTDGSVSPVALNGRGLTCVPLCNVVTTQVPVATDNFVVWAVTDAGTHTVSDTITLTAQQDAVTVDSKLNMIVGRAHDMALSTLSNETTLSEGATTCTPTQATSATTGTALVIYTDINGNKLVGYSPTLSSSSSSRLAVGSPGAFPQASSGLLTTVMNLDGQVGAENAVCGNTASATAVTLTATSTPDEIAGVGPVTRTLAIVVGGTPAAVALTASPGAIACDGTQTSTVTARVTDSAGNNVADGTPVNFIVVSLGTANPITTITKGGSASSTITPLSGAAGGVTVVVTAGSGSEAPLSSIRIECTASSPRVGGRIIDLGTANTGRSKSYTTPLVQVGDCASLVLMATASKPTSLSITGTSPDGLVPIAFGKKGEQSPSENAIAADISPLHIPWARFTLKASRETDVHIWAWCSFR